MARSKFRGHCQVCGRIHRLPGGRLAKHGYTVEYGYFNGECSGGGELPLEKDHTVTDSIRETLAGMAKSNDETADSLESGATDPKWTKTKWEGGRSKTYEVPKESLTTYERTVLRDSEVGKHRRMAEGLRDHAKMLAALTKAVHGKPLIPVTKAELEAEAEGPRLHYRAKAAEGAVRRPWAACSGSHNADRSKIHSTDDWAKVTCPSCLSARARRYADKLEYWMVNVDRGAVITNAAWKRHLKAAAEARHTSTRKLKENAEVFTEIVRELAGVVSGEKWVALGVKIKELYPGEEGASS